MVFKYIYVSSGICYYDWKGYGTFIFVYAKVLYDVSVTGINVKTKVLSTSVGTHISYDDAIIATGAIAARYVLPSVSGIPKNTKFLSCYDESYISRQANRARDKDIIAEV